MALSPESFICPETFACLPTPRVPSEIRDGRVYSKNGEDLTEAFYDGAEKALYVAEETGCQTAILKERSPSCGFGKIYDGTFSGTLTYGNGIAAQMLFEHGIKIYGESDIKRVAFLDEVYHKVYLKPVLLHLAQLLYILPYRHYGGEYTLA